MNENADKVEIVLMHRPAGDCWVSVVSCSASDRRISIILEDGTRKAKSAVLCRFHFSSST
jgi:hypothetical protein